MDKEKEKQEISLVGRLLSMEALIVVMGLLSLGYGIVNRVEINIFWGVMILVGAVALHFVRKKDWKAHWEEQEKYQQAFREMKRLEKERLEKERLEKERQDEGKG
jgi:hypothetical protein